MFILLAIVFGLGFFTGLICAFASDLGPNEDEMIRRIVEMRRKTKTDGDLRAEIEKDISAGGV